MRVRLDLIPEIDGAFPGSSKKEGMIPMSCHLRYAAEIVRRVSCLTVVLGMAVGAQAATQCVNPGVSSCFKTISAAVSAASPGDTINVARGTYKEMVTIAQSLSLVGTDPNSTIIDATGLSNAIYINNGSSPVGNVVVTGFTIQNANFEGLLINGAFSVTIWGNHVVNNDKSLIPSPTNPTCPGLTDVYPFEGNEADDCGEGIHLTSVSSSIISYNTVENNAGGILVSDDSGPTFDNLFAKNVVINNVMDCGITLASHTPFGVYHNTVKGNQVSGNGTSPLNEGGAGVGLFSPAGPTSNYGNSVVNNSLVGNGIGGIAMHTHAPGTETLEDVVIAGNYIAGNGPDPDLGLSGPGGNGIALLVTGGKVGGFVISDNTFENEAEDIAISTDQSLPLTVTLNNFGENTIAIDNLPGPIPPLVTGGAAVNATENYWGCPQGPAAATATGRGARATGCSTFVNVANSTVLSTPWLSNPLSEPLFTPPVVP
jgi:parallel beta-helix repeat protein